MTPRAPDHHGGSGASHESNNYLAWLPLSLAIVLIVILIYQVVSVLPIQIILYPRP